MAKGDLLIFDQFLQYYRGVFDLDTDQWAMALLTDPVTSLLVSETDPALGSSNCNECSAGGNYPAGGINLTLNNSETGGVHTMKLNTSIHSGGLITIDQDASNPTNAKTALIYSKPATSPADAAACYIDLTEDGGSTAVDLTARPLEVTLGIDGTFGDILKVKTSNS